MEAQSTTPRLNKVGTWTEQISSSGKRYYYNSANNVSQWDKPAEWKQAEKMRSSTSSSTPTAAKNGGSGRTPIDKVSPTSSMAQKVVHAHSSQQSHRQQPPPHSSSSSSNFAHHQRPSNTAHSSSSQQQPKPDTAMNKLSSNSSARNSSSESPGLIATKRQKLNEDGMAKITSIASSDSGKKPISATHQPNTATSGGMEAGVSSTSHKNEIHHQKMDERGDHRSTGSGSFGTSHHFHQPMNSPNALNKRPFHSTSTQSITTDRNNVNANRDHQNHSSSKSPTKFSSASPFNFNNSSDQKGGGKYSQQPQQQSPLLAGTTPKPRPLNSINTSALALAALKDQQQRNQQQFGIGNCTNTSNGKATTTSSTTPPTSMDAGTVETKPPLIEKHSSIEGFREDKYLKNWRPEMTAHRRTIGLDSFNHEVKKHTERTTKQMTSIFALDRDIHSIQTLERAAELRTDLLQNRLYALRQRIQELDSKGQ